jgi:hypothetical protein
LAQLDVCPLHAFGVLFKKREDLEQHNSSGDPNAENGRRSVVADSWIRWMEFAA